MTVSVDFGVLGVPLAGPLDAHLPYARQREWRLLSVLLMRPNEAVSVEHLADAMWGATPPPTYRDQVHNCAGRLRRAALAVGDPIVVLRTGRGLTLAIEPTRIDHVRFSDHRTAADRLYGRDQRQAVELYRSALELWRGPVLDGAVPAALMSAAAQLEEARRSATAAYFDLLVEIEPHAALAPLRDVVRDNPFDERAVAVLMRGLGRVGQTGEALLAYAALRDRLSGELGVDPGPLVRHAYAQILLGSTSADPQPADLGQAMAHLANASRELRQAAALLSHAADRPVVTPEWRGDAATVGGTSTMTASAPARDRAAPSSKELSCE